MIDINKKYRTRSGEAVRIYATDAGGFWPVHGAIQSGDHWVYRSWGDDGSGSNSDLDLIEINEKEELLEEARRRYPKGTIFLTPNYKHRFVSDGIVDDVHYSDGILYVNRTIVYDNGKWAEIVKEHTVEVYLYLTHDGQITTDHMFGDVIAKKSITFYEGEGL